MRGNKSKYVVGLLICFCFLTCSGVAVSANSTAARTASIDAALAQQYFQEAENVCRADGGYLWGVSLCAPLLFVDPKTRLVVANEQDAEGSLTKQGNVFTGQLPERVNIANTAVDWSGKRWAMIKWPLPENKYERANLLAHESWHRIQDALKLPASMPANAHLDSPPGRLWLQLEWRALAAALTERGDGRRVAIRNALMFRAYRRTLFPGAIKEERTLEMHEGLAEYTGVKLSGRPYVAQHVAAQLKEAEKRETFVRSFAYASVPAYGILLDDATGGAAWRKNLRPADDLGLLLQRALSIKLPANVKQEAASAATNYSGDALAKTENEREKQRQQRLATYRARLVDGTLLLIPLKKMSLQFNPNNVLPLDGRGTIYPTIRVVDVWGVLNVTEGALMNETFTKIYVPASPEMESQLNAQALHGDGWTLDLNAGWRIKPGACKGDFVLQQSEAIQTPR